jgi:NADPH:quinone reductase-like Zn-dependent oxidoreductase
MPTLPRVMKAVLLTGFGGFDRLDWRADVPVPAPSAGEVLIRVGAAGINNTDINTRIGWYSRQVNEPTTAAAGADGCAAPRTGHTGWSGSVPQFPRIQGADACGVIVAVGAQVDVVRIGERVLVEPAFRAAGEPDHYHVAYFGSERDGAFAEFTCVPAAFAHRIKSPLTDVELASFPCAYSAAENMLTRSAVIAGETVLVTGASGGVGSAAVQLARRRRATVVAVAAAPKTSQVAALGAARVVPREADLVATLGPESVDAVVDVAGGPHFPQLLTLLKRGGRYATAGAIAGPIVELDLRTLYLKDLRLLGCTVLGAEVFTNLVRYIERGEIKPLVAKTYPLSEIVAAQQDFLSKRHVGKIVLLPSA